MTTKIQDETILLRDAIQQVLARQTEPLTSVQINEAYEVNSLGLGVVRVTRALGELVRRKRKPFPIARIAASGRGHSIWAYYNPTLLHPLSATRAAPPELTGLTAPEVMTAGMRFNPIPDAPVDPSPSISLPPEVQAVTITVGSVTIRIGLTR